MDSDIVKAFRIRLKRAGFTNISIKRVRQPYDIYYLRCIDPYGVLVMRTITEDQMKTIPRIVWFT